MTAHDVRNLRPCKHCNHLGNRLTMVSVGGELLHGSCALSRIGVPGLLALPESEQDKLMLGEIGATAMKAILDRR